MIIPRQRKPEQKMMNAANSFPFCLSVRFADGRAECGLLLLTEHTGKPWVKMLNALI
jgi:hypothetical protein